MSTALIVVAVWLSTCALFMAALAIQYRREQKPLTFDAGHERAPWCCGVEHR